VTTAHEVLADAGVTEPPAELPEHGFRINVYRPSKVTPVQFYEALMTICGLKNVAPKPWEAAQVQVESDGATVHVEILTEDGRLAVADVELDRGVRGIL
jgi:hypothetical protein